MSTTRQPIEFTAEFYPGDCNWLKGSPHRIEVVDPHGEPLWRFCFDSRRYAEVVLATTARSQGVPQVVIDEATRLLNEWLPDDSCVSVNCQASTSTVDLPQDNGSRQEDARRVPAEAGGASTFRAPTVDGVLGIIFIAVSAGLMVAAVAKVAECVFLYVG